MSTLGLIFCLLGSVFTKRRHFRPDPFLSCAERWQDLRAVHDSRGPCSERGPFLARYSRGVSSGGDLRGISDAWRADLARASPFSDAWCANLATNWRFSPSEAIFGMHEAKKLPRIDTRERTVREYCHCQVRPRVHQGAILPPSDAGERISRAFCHRRAPENAPRRNLATASRPRTHFAHILPSPGAWERIASISCHRQTSENAQRRHTATASRSSRSALHVGEWVQSLGCAVGFGAQHFLCKGVGIPPSRGLTAGNDFESALFRWATMSPLRVLQSCAVLCAEAKSALTFI